MSSTASNGQRVTVGEVSRNLDDFRSDVRQQFADLRRVIDSLKFVTMEVYLADRRADDRRFKDLERNDNDAADRAKRMTGYIVALATTIIGALVANGAYLVVHK